MMVKIVIVQRSTAEMIQYSATKMFLKDKDGSAHCFYNGEDRIIPAQSYYAIGMSNDASSRNLTIGVSAWQSESSL